MLKDRNAPASCVYSQESASAPPASTRFCDLDTLPSTLPAFSEVPTAPQLWDEDQLQGDGSHMAQSYLYNGLVSIHQAEEFVRAFRLDYATSPFAVIPALPIVDFQRERPFLLMAVVAHAARKHPKLHGPLSAEFRKNLATRFIIDGDNGLDLLQGLLVYLAW
jgi:hypothetical protein